MMKISHVLLKVSDLDAAVAEYRRRGFDVEYGKAKGSYNALIYFADGTYLELLWKTGMPGWAQKLLRLFGKTAFVRRISTWDEADEGLIGLALECDAAGLERAKKTLKDVGQGYFQFKASRLDPRGRKLGFVGVMPDQMHIPFFGTCDTDITRPGFVHPNGVVGFKSLAFGTSQALLPIAQALCDDDRVQLFIGEGVKDLEFLTADAAA